MSLNELVYPALGACLVAVAIMLGSVLAGLLRRLRESDERYRVLATERRIVERELGQHAVDVGALSEAMRALAGSPNPSAGRTAVCEGARTVAGAPVAALLELSGHGSGLTVAAAVGAKLSGMVWPLTGEPSRAAQAVTGAEPIFVADADREGDLDREFYGRTRASSALWHPVLHEGTAIGVLVVAWRRRVAEASPRLAPLMDVLAAEAAVAIGRAELLERLGRIARTDDLTGLPNRRAWEEELPREIARAWREDTTVCVAMIDLDRFKGYNDARGHQAGDRLLKKTAAAWHSELRPYDLLARYGGEEFGLILPGCGLAEAVGAVERLRAATPEEMSCSVGIAEWAREEHPQALVGRADQALYEAKRSGRNRTIPAQAARASA